MASPLSTRDRILALVNASDAPLKPRDLYPHFPDVQPVTVRSELITLEHQRLITRSGGRTSPYVSLAFKAKSEEVFETTYPLAASGRGASPVGRANGTGQSVTLPNVVIQRMTGGRIPREAFMTFASGPSMEPFIPDGHPILIERQFDLVDGAVYCLWLGAADEDVVKRVEVGPHGSVVLRSDNPAVRARTFTPTDDPEMWMDDNGQLMRLVFQGRLIWPSDTAQAAAGMTHKAMRDLVSDLLTRRND